MNPLASSPLRLNVVGAGRVGLTLARLWHHTPGPLRLQAIHNPGAQRRAQARAQLADDVAVVATLAELPPADLWLLAVPDTRIAPVAMALASWARHTGAAPAMVWHCSGFQPSTQLAALQALGWHAASVHPALSFADVNSACAQFPGTVCALEGDAPAVAVARLAFSAIGGQCFELAASDKPLYHGAAVFASNFLPVLASVAQGLWAGSGVPPKHVSALTQRFVRLAADNVVALGPHAALTGPAARGDTAVLNAQAAAMHQRDAPLGAAYTALSALAQRLAQTGHALPPEAEALTTAPVAPQAPPGGSPAPAG